MKMIDSQKRWGNSAIAGVGVNSPAMMEARAAFANQPARKEFIVASISTRANAFGLHGCILVARDGEAWEVGHCQCSPPSSAWSKGQMISVPLEISRYPESGPEFQPVWASVSAEIPRALPTCPPEVVGEIFTSVAARG